MHTEITKRCKFSGFIFSAILKIQCYLKFLPYRFQLSRETQSQKYTLRYKKDTH